MKRIHKRYLKTVSVTWSFSAVLLVFGYVTVLGPQGGVQRDISRELLDKEGAYNEALEATQQYAKDKLAEQLKQARHRVGDFVVGFEESANVTFDIGGIVDELEIGSFNIENRGSGNAPVKTNTTHVSENHVDLTLCGDFNQFAFFLNALERHRPVLFVERFSISAGDGRGGKPQIKMNLVYLVRKAQEH